MKALSVENLTVSYSKVEAINEITLFAEKGDFLCILGPNGGGKTTLLSTVLGLLKPDSGEILFNGKSKNSKAVKIGYVPQTAMLDRSFPISVLETVLTGMLGSGIHPFHRFSSREKEKAITYLSLVGLADYSKRQIGELSGGEFQRLLIARALASNPEILLLDEPTANVDAYSRDKIFSLLYKLKNKGITVITVTHDLKAASENATKIALIDRKLKYFGKPLPISELTGYIYGKSEGL